MYKLIAQDGEARRGEVNTAHGVFQTPAFMPVGTYGAVKSLSPEVLTSIKAEIILSNTYHLMERPGVEIIKLNGGLHNFMSWDGPILTDSGGYQVFSLAKKRKITEEGVEFNSALNGSKLFLNPEKCMELQLAYGVDIAMVLDECTPYPADISVAEKSMNLSLRWAQRSRDSFKSDKSNLFGIIQGGVYKDLREKSLEILKKIDFEGYAIGGLSVGEPKEDLRNITKFIAPLMPIDKPRYLMGVGTPSDILGAVKEGIDMFDCVMPTRSGRTGLAFTWQGKVNLKNSKYQNDKSPLDENCELRELSKYSKSYLNHLIKSNELMASMLISLHNIYFYQQFMREIRKNIQNGTFQFFYKKYINLLD